MVLREEVVRTLGLGPVVDKNFDRGRHYLIEADIDSGSAAEVCMPHTQTILLVAGRTQGYSAVAQDKMVLTSLGREHLEVEMIGTQALVEGAVDRRMEVGEMDTVMVAVDHLDHS